MQVVRKLPTEKGTGLRVCGAGAVETERGFRVGLVVRYRGEQMLKSASLAPYRPTEEEALADLPRVAWSERPPVPSRPGWIPDLGEAPIYLAEELAQAA